MRLSFGLRIGKGDLIVVVLAMLVAFRPTRVCADHLYLVKDINTVSFTGGDSNPMEFASIGAVTYFAATEAIHGKELWKTDGTAAGTALVKDIYPREGSGNPQALTNVNGAELWRSNGGSTGTYLHSDIAPGGDSSYPQDLVVSGKCLFFRAVDSTTSQRYELWEVSFANAATDWNVYR
jgi:ELWxxDGT repeat protein